MVTLIILIHLFAKVKCLGKKNREKIIDYAAMESRQSDARNKVIVPVFKKLGIIDQWSNGLDWRIFLERDKSYRVNQML